jgi:hypothetical protein
VTGHSDQTARVVDIELDRRFRIRIAVVEELSGFRSLRIENVQRKEVVQIKDYLLDAFRRKLHAFVLNPSHSSPEYVKFRNTNRIKIESRLSGSGERMIVVIDLASGGGSAAISFPAEKVASFFAALFDPCLRHPSGCLERVISYHRMLQLAFPNVSESLSGDMGFRENFLCLDIRNPVVKAPVSLPVSADITLKDFKSRARQIVPQASDSNVLKIKDFKSRLGARKKGAATVNLDEFLASGESPKPDEKGAEDRREQTAVDGVIDLGLSAGRLKGTTETGLLLRPDEEDLQELRDAAIQSGGLWDFYLGFELVDCWYQDRKKKWNSFRFPLYFIPVKLTDLGGDVSLSFPEGSWCYLNYLGLATLVSRFSRSKAQHTRLEKLFQRLLYSRFEWKGRSSRPYLMRRLPVAEDCFAEQRRVLFGQEERGPIGGIFEDLVIQHVSFDLERTLFFVKKTESSARDEALQDDLKTIQHLAITDQNAYFASLLGRIFTPEQPQIAPGKKPPARGGSDRIDKVPDSSFQPFETSLSAQRLLSEIDERDILLVEGPPGTGKTFSMLNLLVHAVCKGMSVLVVSDKQSALEALYEKVVDFCRAEPVDDVDASFREFCISAGVKCLRLEDQDLTRVQVAASKLREQLRLDIFNTQHIGRSPWEQESVRDRLNAIDHDIHTELEEIDRALSSQFQEFNRRTRVCPRNWHESSRPDVEGLTDFISYLLRSPDLPQTDLFVRIRNFIRNRESILMPLYPALAATLDVPDYRRMASHLRDLQKVLSVLDELVEIRPRHSVAFAQTIEPLIGTSWHGLLTQKFGQQILSREHTRMSGLTRIKDRLIYPLLEDIQNLQTVVRDELALLSLDGIVRKSHCTQFSRIHRFLCQPEGQEYCLAWGIIQSMMMTQPSMHQVSHVRAEAKGGYRLICERLDRIEHLRKQRKRIVRNKFLQELSTSRSRIDEVLKEGSGSFDPIAEIDSLFESVARAESKNIATAAFDRLKRILQRVFRVWLIKKDQVPLLLPSERECFDVVIIDEATQCRVDDALPLIFRARKVIAVGDDRQTVLQRGSVLDDYLFEDLNLEEHLQILGAAGVKSGGSHIFGLVKGLKQARILLDEHYRCPPDIIEFSNRYVYGNQLQIMQWRPANQAPSVVVDYTESRTRVRNRPQSGKYKGIEIGMIDRFFGFVERSVLAYEAETGRKVNLSSDVAICYFLLKNEEYVREAKQSFLRKMNRGEDVLDGAGAVLQGKERDLIFYLWDITRANFSAFLQGDDPLRRKGELNVLMSRPKKRAYHYLHKDFASLAHHRSSIAQYLWETFQRSRARVSSERSLMPREISPSPQMLPWRRGDGHLLYEQLRLLFQVNGLAREFSRYEPQYGVAVGNPERRVDLVLSPKRAHPSEPHLAVVELSGFESQASAQILARYHSLLLRAQPTIIPVFIHNHELYLPASPAFLKIRTLVCAAAAASGASQDN